MSFNCFMFLLEAMPSSYINTPDPIFLRDQTVNQKDNNCDVVQRRKRMIKGLQKDAIAQYRFDFHILIRIIISDTSSSNEDIALQNSEYNKCGFISPVIDSLQNIGSIQEDSFSPILFPRFTPAKSYVKVCSAVLRSRSCLHNDR